MAISPVIKKCLVCCISNFGGSGRGASPRALCFAMAGWVVISGLGGVGVQVGGIIGWDGGARQAGQPAAFPVLYFPLAPGCRAYSVRRPLLKTVEAIAEILKREGVEYLPCFPTTPVIESCAEWGIRPIVCRQERWGWASPTATAGRTTATRWACSRCSTAPARKTPIPAPPPPTPIRRPCCCCPWAILGNGKASMPHYSSLQSYASITKSVEQVNAPNRTAEIMRPRFRRPAQGRPGRWSWKSPPTLLWRR